MELFSELYSKYYTLIRHILTLADTQGITLSGLREIVTKEGFLESSTSLIPALLSQEEDGYHLLQKRGENYYSILKHHPGLYLTNLETSWLKALLADPKMSLFLEKDDIHMLKRELEGVTSLFDEKMFSPIQKAYSYPYFQDEAYILKFKKISAAIQKNILLTITYKNVLDQLLTETYVPFKIEYEVKYDRFRLIGVSLQNNQLTKLERIDLVEMINITEEETGPSSLEIARFIESCKMKEPIQFELSNERSGFDRVFMYLSNYERISEFNDETNTCLVNLYYYPFDEAEIIRTLISFGPIIKLLSPFHVRDQVKKEINKQYNIFANFFS